MDKIEKLLRDFFSTRIGNYRQFVADESANRQVGLLKWYSNGSELMDFMYSIMSNIEEQLYVEKLIPHVFTSPQHLIDSIKRFRDYIAENQVLIYSNEMLVKNNESEELDHTLGFLQGMCNELISFFDYLIEIHDSEELSLPYKELRSALATRDLESFFETLKAIIGTVAYPIHKEKEGYLHTVIHVILKILGFDIISEESTNIGRIDAVIRFTNIIYIFEFKQGDAEEALSQIEEKKYYQKFMIDKKSVIGVGVSFGDRQIKDYIVHIYK
ncbi:MAG: PD-(D/E)XK nuclease domain-containing protein [Saprospiraceae bacterium]|nr:PD-(D/E)XK nuclease domain-containing protein [Saprospiraceae bacterium]